MSIGNLHPFEMFYATSNSTRSSFLLVLGAISLATSPAMYITVLSKESTNVGIGKPCLGILSGEFQQMEAKDGCYTTYTTIYSKKQQLQQQPKYLTMRTKNYRLNHNALRLLGWYMMSLLCTWLVLECFLSHSLLVSGLVLHEQIVGFRLGGTIWIGIIQQILNPNQYLLQCNGWAPSFLFIQNGKTNSPRRIHIGME